MENLCSRRQVLKGLAFLPSAMVLNANNEPPTSSQSEKIADRVVIGSFFGIAFGLAVERLRRQTNGTDSKLASFGLFGAALGYLSSLKL